MFADDLTTGIAGKNIETSTALLQELIRKLTGFATKNAFIFLSTKSTITLFENKNSNTTPAIYINNIKREVVEIVKILGITFDKKLTWLPHILKLKADCRARLNLIKVISNKTWGANQNVLRHTYLTIVRGKLDYGSIIYGTGKPYILKKLDPEKQGRSKNNHWGF